jgi:hypothetical protein
VEHARLREQFRLVFTEHARHLLGKPTKWQRLLRLANAPRDDRLADGELARPDLNPQRDAAQLVIDDPPADGHLGPLVCLGAHTLCAQVVRQHAHRLSDTLAGASDEHRRLDGRKPGRYPQAMIVAVDHDHRAQQPR